MLEEVMERAQSGSTELVFIEGPLGTGKASIAQHLNRGRKSLFTSGKFEANHSSPFAAIISACTELITCICHDKELEEKVSYSVSVEMHDQDIFSLLAFLPNFRYLCDQEDCVYRSSRTLQAVGIESKIEDKKDLLTRIRFAVRAFLRITTKHSNRPLIFCLYDLQWADDASMDILEFIADDHAQSRFIVMVTLSVDDTIERHRAHIWKEGVSRSKTRSEVMSVIKVGHFTLEQLNTFVSVVTGMREGDTLPLATHLMTKSNGDLFAALQILEHWQNQRMLTYNHAISKWQWDLEKMQNTTVPEDLVDLVSNRITHLAPNIQRVLQLGACLGYGFDPTLLEVVKGAIPGELLDVRDVLRACCEEGLIELQGDGRVVFLHNTIHQASLLLLPRGENLEKLHLRIGLLIWNHIKQIKEPPDWMLFLCSDFLVFGMKHIEDDSMMLEVAEVCHKVGKKAIELSAFIVAAELFGKGIELLNQIVCRKWEDFHELTESMFVSFSEVQYYNGKIDSSLEAIKELLAHDPSKSAFVRANITRLEILKAECKLKEFVSSSLTFLNELGVNFPMQLMKAQALLQRRGVMKMLKEMDDSTIMSLPKASDLNTIVILKVMNMMIIPVETLGLVHLSSMIAHKAVFFSITRGITELSSEAFVVLGAYLISERGMLAEGYRMGQLALSMSQRLNPSTLDGRVIFWSYSMTIPWQGTPLAECIPSILQGHTAALKQGDPFTAFMIINIYFSMSYYASRNLPSLLQDIETFSCQILDYGQKTIYLQILPIWQCVLNLCGRSDDPCNVDSGEAMDKQHLVGNNNNVGEQARWSYLMQISFYVCNYELASTMSDKLQPLNIGFMKAHILYPVRVFFFGLVAIQNARSTGKRKYKQEAAKHISVIRHWVEKKAVNFEHKLLILEAEYESLFAKSGLFLQSKYDAAIKMSVKSKFVQDAALAAQLAGRVLSQSEETQTVSESYFLSAYDMWVSWGAFAVAKSLEERLRDEFPGISLDISPFDY